MKIELSTHAERCPMCNGAGEFPFEEDNILTAGSFQLKRICFGCEGKGWITVEDPPRPVYELDSLSANES